MSLTKPALPFSHCGQQLINAAGSLGEGISLAAGGDLSNLPFFDPLGEEGLTNYVETACLL